MYIQLRIRRQPCCEPLPLPLGLFRRFRPPRLLDQVRRYSHRTTASQSRGVGPARVGAEAGPGIEAAGDQLRPRGLAGAVTRAGSRGVVLTLAPRSDARRGPGGERRSRALTLAWAP